MKNINALVVIFVLVVIGSATVWSAESPARWDAAKVNAWREKEGWLVGCNFTPSTAVNQLEMWQADRFDIVTIDRELGWAQQLGFNSVRVFLHDLLWRQDAKGFLKRIDQFLKVADKHQIKVVFVFFDSCWDPDPRLGKQHEPKPFVHNSGWVQSPGREYMEHPARIEELIPYVQGVVRHFRGDKRIAFWDVFNEPDNFNVPAYNKIEPPGKEASALLLLKDVFAWARQAKATQPLSSGVWKGDWGDPGKLSAFEKVQLGESDVITFHNYDGLGTVEKCIANLRRYGRPIICTEYMARPHGSRFDPILGGFKREKVGAFNWGFVSGKTQTIYPWDSWTKSYKAEPSVWFHDIFRMDGTPYDAKEVEYIRSVTMGGGNGQ